MNKNILWLPVLVCLQAFATKLPPSFVEINATNNPDCVEYISYQKKMYCSNKQILSKTPVIPDIVNQEKLAIQFDDRPWHAAWGKKASGIVTIEYVVLGENINHWNELVTSQFFPGLEEVTLKEFANTIFYSLNKTGISPEITILKQNEHQVIFEFKISKPSNMQQDEIQSITKTPKGFYVLHYVIKKANMGADNRKKWLKNIENSKIKE